MGQPGRRQGNDEIALVCRGWRGRQGRYRRSCSALENAPSSKQGVRHSPARGGMTSFRIGTWRRAAVEEWNPSPGKTDAISSLATCLTWPIHQERLVGTWTGPSGIPWSLARVSWPRDKFSDGSMATQQARSLRAATREEPGRPFCRPGQISSYRPVISPRDVHPILPEDKSSQSSPELEALRGRSCPGPETRFKAG